MSLSPEVEEFCTAIRSAAAVWHKLLTISNSASAFHIVNIGRPDASPTLAAPMHDTAASDPHEPAPPAPWLRRWWRRQTPVHQDRFAMLAPLAAVLLFLAAIISAFWYLRLEEIEREQEAVRRDVEYAQQRMRLRLLERQEQLMRLARDISNREIDPEEFMGRAESMVVQYPELQVLTWIDDRRKIIASYATPSVATPQLRIAGEVLRPGETESIYSLARDLQQ